MNAKQQLIASFALLAAAGSAFAQSTDYAQPNERFVSTKTRAEVIAELKQAQAEGVYVVGGEAYVGERPVLAKNTSHRDAGTIDTAQRKSAVPDAGS